MELKNLSPDLPSPGSAAFTPPPSPDSPPSVQPDDARSPASPDPSPEKSRGVSPSDGMTGLGRLIFQISTGEGSIPLAQARVIVRASRETGRPQLPPRSVTDENDTAFPDAGTGTVIAVLISGTNGKTEPLPLPAPPLRQSLSPTPPDAPAPYALYDAEIRLEHYFVQSYFGIPIFDGITSLQPVILIPLPENGLSDGLRPDSRWFFEGENPNL